jgi:hypothetical protein
MIVVSGVYYKSLAEASRQLKLPPSTIRLRVESPKYPEYKAEAESRPRPREPGEPIEPETKVKYDPLEFYTNYELWAKRERKWILIKEIRNKE